MNFNRFVKTLYLGIEKRKGTDLNRHNRACISVTNKIGRRNEKNLNLV